jgi:type VI secretion system protein
MTLRLTIENVASLTSGDPTEMLLDEHGLVIGRAAHADWTLPDTRNHISSLHAEIDYDDGRYVLTDRSTNGVFVNGGSRLTSPHVMRDGDLITIGQYEIRASVTSGSSSASVSNNAAGSPFGGGLDWASGSAGGAKAADTHKFGREPPKPLFQSGGDPLMNAFAPPAAAFSPAPQQRAPDPFGLATTPAAAPLPAAPGNPFGSAAAPGDPFGVSAAPTPFAPSAPDPFGVAAPAVPSSTPFAAQAAAGDPFGTARPAAAPNPFGIPVAAQPAAPAVAPSADPWAQIAQVRHPRLRDRRDARGSGGAFDRGAYRSPAAVGCTSRSGGRRAICPLPRRRRAQADRSW